MALCDCERSHNGLGMAGRECDCPRECPAPIPTIEIASMLLRTTASRMQGRVDAIVERDGCIDAAVTGRGVGISYLFARDIVRACENGEKEIERLRRLLQDVVDDMMFNVAPNKGTMAKIEDALQLPKAKVGASLLRKAITLPPSRND
jgi:hypothetical protein